MADSDFRKNFDIIQQKRDPTYYVARLNTNEAIGRVIIPKVPVDEDTECVIQWFQEAALTKVSKKELSPVSKKKPKKSVAKKAKK